MAEGNGTSSNGTTRAVLIGQDHLANLLADILGKQQQTQQRQMEILERLTRSDKNSNTLGEFQHLKPHAFLEYPTL
jgi:hypothetical protein